jgi:hypothetical protein
VTLAFVGPNCKERGKKEQVEREVRETTFRERKEISVS